MTPAPIPPEENKRLQSLRALNLLDTESEARFERITQMVCELLDVPIAAVSLVDDTRQWFKSVRGLDTRETPREVAFCPHAIATDRTMVVDDAHKDARFADNPLVRQAPHIAFYAGHPLRAPDGAKVGTLCAIDTKPRKLSPEQLHTLSMLAELVEMELGAMEQSKIEQSLRDELADESE